MSIVLIPPCSHLPQRMSVSVPVTLAAPVHGYIDLREIKLDDKMPSTRVEGMLICIGGDITTAPKTRPIAVNTRTSFALVHEPGSLVRVRHEPIEAISDIDYKIRGIQIAVLPYIGEDESPKILAYLRLVSILLNCDLVLNSSVGAFSFPFSTLETIPIGPEDNLKPYGIEYKG